MVMCDGKVYIGGGVDGNVGSSYGNGSNRIDVYSPTDNSWRPSIEISFFNFAMTTLNNQLITAGGMDRSNQMNNKVHSLNVDYLEEYTKMITPRSSATAVGHQGTLIITGGRNNLKQKLATTELFDSTTGQWYTTSDLSQPHDRLHSVIVDDTLYLLGGCYQNNTMSPAVFKTSLDSLSSHKLQWSSQQDTPWCSSAPVSLQGRHLLTVGGVKKTGSGNVRTSDIHKFNKISHSWEVIGQIPSARSSLAAVAIANNKILVVGGSDNNGYFANTVWIGSCESQ